MSQLKGTFAIMILIMLAAGCDARPDSSTGASPSETVASGPESGPLVTQPMPGLQLNPSPTGEQHSPANNVVLSWRREGGFAGFCDELKVSRTGEFTASLCLGTPARTKTGRLSKAEMVTLDRWREAFGVTVIKTKDAAVADAMTLTLTMKGTGPGKATEAERQQLLDWAQRTFEKNRPSTSTP